MARPGALFIACLFSLAACRGDSAARGSAIAITDDWGRTVALAAPATRIVSLAPATTELVFALGAGERLVGRTAWCDYPAEAARVTSVGNGIGPNVEAIAGQRPDLVLLYPSESNRAALGQLEQLGIAVAVLEQDAIAEWQRTVRAVGVLVGREATADSLLADVNAALAAVRAAPSADSPSVFIAVGANPPIAIGQGSFMAELVQLAGGRNAFADIAGPSAPVSLEAIVARDPAIVLVLGPDSVTGIVARRPGWPAIRAVREGRLRAVDGSEYNRPSPRLAAAVQGLKSVLHR